jgi:hypothetical protein
MQSFVRIGKVDLDVIIARVCSIWPDRPSQPAPARTRASWTPRSRGCVTTTRPRARGGAEHQATGEALNATSVPTSMQASVGSCLLRLERTASGSLTAAVDGEFDQPAAITLVRTLELMAADGVPLFLDLGWVSRIDVEAFCTIVAVRARHGAPVSVIAVSPAVERMADLFHAARRASSRLRSQGSA